MSRSDDRVLATVAPKLISQVVLCRKCHTWKGLRRAKKQDGQVVSPAKNYKQAAIEGLELQFRRAKSLPKGWTWSELQSDSGVFPAFCLSDVSSNP